MDDPTIQQTVTHSQSVSTFMSKFLSQDLSAALAVIICSLLAALYKGGRWIIKREVNRFHQDLHTTINQKFGTMSKDIDTKITECTQATTELRKDMDLKFDKINDEFSELRVGIDKVRNHYHEEANKSLVLNSTLAKALTTITKVEEYLEQARPNNGSNAHKSSSKYNKK